MDVLSGLTLAAPAGLNAYIPLLAVALLVVEVVADKVPAVDHVNDVIQTVVRAAPAASRRLRSPPALRRRPGGGMLPWSARTPCRSGRFRER